MDTGSHSLWVPAKNCSNCSRKLKKYDPLSSKTSLLSPIRDHFVYGKGEVKGSYAKDIVYISGIESNMSFLLVDEQTET
jgi:hypothetical protein